MCNDNSESSTTTAFENGADEVWGRPLDDNCIKNMWRLVAKKNVEDQNKQILKKRCRGYIEKLPIVTNNSFVSEKDNNDDYHPLAKKTNLSWSTELREKFKNAVNQLGPTSKNLFPIFFYLFLFCLYL
jgi:hypothetical protein